MALQSLDIVRRSATTTPSPERARAGHGHGREADRHDEMHRLQGVSGRVHGMERPAR